jgi:hypothetical protein
MNGNLKKFGSLFLILGSCGMTYGAPNTESLILKEIFPGASRNIRKTIFLSLEQQHALNALEPGRTPVKLFSYQEIVQRETLLGYATTVKAEGKSGPFRVLIVMQPDFTVKRVEILDYPFVYGQGVKNKTFLSQFSGLKSWGLFFGDTLHAVTGATSSSAGVLLAVENALICLGQPL